METMKVDGVITPWKYEEIAPGRVKIYYDGNFITTAYLVDDRDEDNESIDWYYLIWDFEGAIGLDGDGLHDLGMVLNQLNSELTKEKIDEWQESFK